MEMDDPRRAAEAKDAVEDEYKAIFAIFDKDGDQCINCDEIYEIMKSLGMGAHKGDIKEMVREINDGNDIGTVSYDQFRAVITKERQPDKDAKILEAFHTFDDNDDGFINTTHLRERMNQLGELLTEDEKNSLIQEADPEGEGQINYKEFMKEVMDKP